MKIHTPPLQAIFIASLITVFSVIAGILILSSAPKIGVEFQSNSDQNITISRVYENSPAEKAGLKQGDKIRAIHTQTSESILLNRNTLLSDPDIFARYAQFNGFIEKQKQISRLLEQPSFYLLKDNNESIEVHPTTEIKLSWLPVWFWLILILAGITFIIGTAIFAHNPFSKATFFLALMASGLFSATVFYTIYGARELSIPLVEYLRIFIALKHVALTVFAIAFISMVWSFPKELKFGFVYWTGVLISTVYLFLAIFQIVELPIHNFYFIPYLSPTLLGLYATLLQYENSRDSLINKAVMLWTSSATTVSMLTIYVLHILPILITGYPISDLVVQFVFFFLFVGYAFGVTRYRLFDIDRWWFNTWLVFFFAIGVLMIDAVVVYFWNTSQGNAFGIALLVSFWIYFPLREKLWKVIFKKNHGYLINDYLAEIVALFSTIGKADIENKKYIQLFNFIYQPSGYKLLTLNNHGISNPTLSKNGLELNIPINSASCLVLTGKNRSNNLFNRQDEKFSRSIIDFIRKVSALADRQKQAANNERARIMRDIHDDVGSKLLSLIHGTQDPQAAILAQDTLQALRLSIIPLQQDGPKNLVEAIDYWSNEIQTRINELDIGCEFDLDTQFNAHLEVRPYINTTRILREITNNLIKHSTTKHVKIGFKQTRNQLTITFDQQGNSVNPADFQQGTGLNNITSRLHEIAGNSTIERISTTSTDTLRYTIRIPLIEQYQA